MNVELICNNFLFARNISVYFLFQLYTIIVYILYLIREGRMIFMMYILDGALLYVLIASNVVSIFNIVSSLYFVYLTLFILERPLITPIIFISIIICNGMIFPFLLGQWMNGVNTISLTILLFCMIVFVTNMFAIFIMKGDELIKLDKLSCKKIIFIDLVFVILADLCYSIKFVIG